MGSPKPPQKITQEPFEADGAHLRRLSSLDPGATASSEDLSEYVQDILYTPIEPELLRYVLPFCLDEWRKELPLIEEWFEFVGDKLPTGVKDEFEALKQRLSESS